MKYNWLESIAAVEINTAIVEEIVDEMFIPWEAYQGIFYLSRSNLEKSTIAQSLWLHYLQLRRQLELAYCLLAIDRHSRLYNRRLVREIKRDLPLLTQKNSEWETLTTRLPEPIPSSRHETMSGVNELLSDRSFLNTLRQLQTRKLALDRRNRILSSNLADDITNSTYAQTSLQLDGKIINRYSQAILERSDRDLLLQLHQQSTSAGEHQWRKAIEFMLSVFN